MSFEEAMDMFREHYSSDPVSLPSYLFILLPEKIDELKKLIKQGANVNETSTRTILGETIEHTIFGDTLLMKAVETSRRKNNEIIKILLEAGADPNIKNKLGRTALMKASKNAAHNSTEETVKLLLDAKADPNLKDNRGWTALMAAASLSNNTSSLETVKLLLEYGADPYMKNNEGKTAFELCPTDICKQTIERHIYKNRYNKTFPRLAAQYSTNTPIPKQIWEIILLRKDQQRLCQNLTTEYRKGALLALAEILEIPIDESLTKNDLCNIISQQLTLGRYFKKENIDLLQTDKMVKELASRYGINTNQPLSGILDELSLLI